jgi:modulator of drug activity B
MNTLLINAHLTYPGWSPGKLNMTFMEIAKTWFAARGHHVTETFIERGYDPAEEVAKHVSADLVILQTPVNWFGARGFTRNTWTRFLTSAWPRRNC